VFFALCQTRNHQKQLSGEKKEQTMIRLKNTTSVFLLAIACFAFLPKMQAAPQVSPGPDGCYSNFTTAEGCNALAGLGSGQGNTGLGWYALFSAAGSNFNTAVGAGALDLNTADSNTAVGAAALLLNTTGSQNVAVGTDALVFNNAGADNNAVGFFALFNNTSGNFNNAHGREALTSNVDGIENEAIGDEALLNSQHGSYNTAVGDSALLSQNGGDENTAVGRSAGESIIDGSNNVAIGGGAGSGIIHANNVIAINAPGVSSVFGDADNSCYIANIHGAPVDGATALTVSVDADGKLGTPISSRRFKHDIKSMDKASEAILALKPVTFHYNNDKKNTLCFGLIAEEVAQVDPDLVIRDKNRDPLTVRYDQINAMLLNEFLKEHRKVEKLTNDFQATVAQQQKEISALAATVKDQVSQIQKVSAQLEASKPAPQMVNNP
jgi:endosialidase-like protein